MFCEKDLRNKIWGFSLKVDTGNKPPVTCQQPRYGDKKTPIINKLVDKLKHNGMVEDNGGPWGSLIVFAAKPHQDDVPWKEFQWRLCVSYRKLNQVTRP